MPSYRFLRSGRCLIAAAVLFSPALAVANGAAPTSGSVASPNGIVMSIDVGYSYLDLGSTKFTQIVDWLNLNVIGQVTDHDGEFDGVRTNLSFANLARGNLFGQRASLGVRGFYGHYEGDQNSSCTFVNLVSDCAVFPLVDPRSAGGADYSGGLFSDWRAHTSREVHNWGVAVEAVFGTTEAQGGIKDTPVLVETPFQWRLGAAVKGLNQRTRYHAEDFGPLADPVTLSDKLDTTYYGAYVGFNTRQDLGGGYLLLLSGEGGIYYADTDYSGYYFATDRFSSPGPLEQRLSLSDDKAAFIGTLGLELRRNFGMATVGLFAEAEWYSYAPNMRYNNYDHNGGGILDLVGNNDGTSIGDGSAFVYTVGGRVTVPLHK
jgi:hypothetical protein